jgi:Trk-type K+ transport system membrane component
VALLIQAAFSRRSTDSAGYPKALRGAAGVTAVMVTLIAITTLVLTYRQSASLETCLSEAVSACCNVGLTTGLTARLPMEDNLAGPILLRFASRVALILAMLLGRTLPIGILLACTRPAGDSQRGPSTPSESCNPQK